ncbi:ribosome maturation factor RimM [bacterium]|nr:ribosome maturation factor RimM [bacterium]
MAERDDLLAIAHLVRPHGLRGEIAAEPLVPEVVDAVGLILDRRLFLRDRAGRVSEVRAIGLRPHQARWLITIEGIESMDDAEALRGADLCLPRAELPELPADTYYEADLERCRVIDEKFGEIGHVEALETGGAQPNLKVRRANGAAVLIPWVKAFFVSVDVPAGELKTNLPDDFPGL